MRRMRTARPWLPDSAANRLINRIVHQTVVSVVLLYGLWAGLALAQSPEEALQDNMQKLAGGGPVEAFKAAREIGKLAHQGQACDAAIPLLMDHLDDGRKVRVVYSFGSISGDYVHEAARSALVAIGKPAVAPLIRRVDAILPGSGRVGDQMAIEALGEIGDPRALDVLQPYILGQGRPFRHDAIRAVAKIGGETAWASLAAILDNDTGKTRLIAAQGLASLDAAQASPLIAPHIGAMLSESDVRQGAITLVHNCRIQSAAPQLVKLLDDQDEMVVAHSLTALAVLSVPAEALPRLVALSRLKPHNERAAKAIAAIDDPAARNGLTALLDDNDPVVRRAAAAALGKLKDPRVVPLLYARLNDPDAEMRWQAMNDLKMTPGPEALQALLLATANEDGKMARMAENALRTRREAAPAQALLGMLGHPQARVRKNVALVLANGPEDPAVEDAMLSALNDPAPEVRYAAGQALAQVGTRQAFIPLLRALYCEPTPTSVHDPENPGLSFCQALSSLASPLYVQEPEKWLNWALGKMTEIGSRDPDRLLLADSAAMFDEMHRYRSTTVAEVRERALILLQDLSVDKRRAGVIALGIMAAPEDLARIQTLDAADPGLASDIRMAVAWMEEGQLHADGQGVAEEGYTPDWALDDPTFPVNQVQDQPADSGAADMETAPAQAPPSIDFEVTMILPGERGRAMIGGKMVRVGDQIGQWTVKAIKADAVTITCDGYDAVLGLSK